MYFDSNFMGAYLIDGLLRAPPREMLDGKVSLTVGRAPLLETTLSPELLPCLMAIHGTISSKSANISSRSCSIVGKL